MKSPSFRGGLGGGEVSRFQVMRMMIFGFKIFDSRISGGIHNNLKIRDSARVSRSRSLRSCQLFLDILESRKSAWRFSLV